MKAGEIVTFAHVEGAHTPSVNTHRRTGNRDAVPIVEVAAFSHFGTHSTEDYGISDGSAPVENGRAEYVVVCKVIAVVRRSVKVET
jgi:hypothetical protein